MSTANFQVKEVATLQGHIDSVYSVAVSPSGGQIASGAYFNLRDYDIRLWDWGKKLAQPSHCLSSHSDGISALCYSYGGAYLASSSWDKSVKIWSLGDSTQIGQTQENAIYYQDHWGSWDESTNPIEHWSTPREQCSLQHEYHVKDCIFSNDGRRVLAGTLGYVSDWDIRTGTRLQQWIHSNDRKVQMEAIAYEGSGYLVGAGGDDGGIRLWDARGPHDKVVCLFKEHTKGILSIKFSNDGNFLVSSARDSTSKLWDLRMLKKKSSRAENDIQGTRSVQTFMAAHNLKKQIRCDLSPDGSLLVTVSRDGTWRLWSTARGSLILDVLPGSSIDSSSGLCDIAVSRGWYCCAFHPLGEHIVMGGDDCALHVWKIKPLYGVALGKAVDRDVNPKQSKPSFQGKKSHNGHRTTYSGSIVPNGSTAQRKRPSSAGAIRTLHSTSFATNERDPNMRSSFGHTTRERPANAPHLTPHKLLHDTTRPTDRLNKRSTNEADEASPAWKEDTEKLYSSNSDWSHFSAPVVRASLLEDSKNGMESEEFDLSDMSPGASTTRNNESLEVWDSQLDLRNHIDQMDNIDHIDHKDQLDKIRIAEQEALAIFQESQICTLKKSLSEKREIVLRFFVKRLVKLIESLSGNQIGNAFGKWVEVTEKESKKMCTLATHSAVNYYKRRGYFLLFKGVIRNLSERLHMQLAKAFFKWRERTQAGFFALQIRQEQNVEILRVKKIALFSLVRVWKFRRMMRAWIAWRLWEQKDSPRHKTGIQDSK